MEDPPIDLSFALLCLFFTGYQLENPLALKFTTLSYQVPESDPPVYVHGPDDVYFVAFWVIAFTFIRAFAMEYIFKALARYNRITTPDKTQRFCEQCWSVLYYSASWSLGMYIMYHSDYWLDTRHFWIGYPHKQLSGLFKFYYLSQIGFWIQQIFVLHVEKRRRDYVEMFVHHILTNTLLIASYYTNFVRIGHAVLCIMDVADIFLCSAKAFRYIQMQALCDVLFGLFVIVWFATRHGLFLVIGHSVMTEPEQYNPYLWDPDNGIYYTHEVRYMFIGLMGLLQVVLLIWAYFIVKVLYRVLTGNNAHDNRSDSEDISEPETVAKKVA
ncbi:TLC domain-containing protein [Dimargaris cristalligena]|uniref:TLC domain-containing protein n=1 Tax=Dimargaris cristalligena TaxID=215637 RepID=A0A4P9ZTZ1_9FUNG|nr:TLC domain-containing protein [Dimargaris cristalligena]|eukprot:RKP36242.1 TLC domain-containing protein [Dimargaris cristalligena]